MVSGFAPGANVAKFGGPLCISVSCEARLASARVYSGRADGIEILPAPIPEVTFELRGAPPEILTAVELFPAAPPAPAPAAASAPFASGAPSGAPGFCPSAEIVARAARLPAGGAAGAGGPGLAESAINACAAPLGEVSCAATSGAGSAAPCCFLFETRGATPALICNFGRSGPEFV